MGKASKDTKLTESGKLKHNLCDKYPDKCDKASTTYDACAEDWTACLTKVEFHFCVNFPDMCVTDIFGPQSESF